MSATKTEPIVYVWERPFVLEVEHNGKRKMVGKIVVLRGHATAFFHEHGASQYHGQTKCPCPLDAAVLAYCVQRGVRWVYCFDRDNLIMRRIAVGAALSAPTFRYDGRLRHAPAEEAWETRRSCIVRRGVGGGKQYHRADGSLILFAPFIPARDTVLLDED